MKTILMLMLLGGVAAAETGPDFVSAKSPAAATNRTLTASDARNPIDPTDVVAFANDSAGLLSSAVDQIDKAATWLRAHPGFSLVVEGHTDATGANSYNASLAYARAAAVRSRLQSQGISPDRIVLVAYGEEAAVHPANINDRRVVMYATRLPADQVAGASLRRGAVRAAWSANGRAFDMPAGQ